MAKKWQKNGILIILIIFSDENGIFMAFAIFLEK